MRLIVWRRISSVFGLLLLLGPVCASGSAAAPAREPVRITVEGGRLIVAPVPALRQAIRRHFPGYDLPPLTAFDPELRKLLLLRRPPPGDPVVSFVCIGDFDGNGLPDVVLFLKNPQNRWILVAFHQTYRGEFRPYRLARMKPTGLLFSAWIMRHPPGRLHYSDVAAIQSKYDWIEMEDDDATENYGYYFRRGRYRSVQLAGPGYDVTVARWPRPARQWVKSLE